MRSALHDVLACQRRLGLTAIELSEGCCRLRRTTWSSRVLFWTFQVTLLLAAGSYVKFWSFRFEPTHTGVANHYAHVMEIMETLSIVVMTAWLRLHQDRLMRLLNQLLKLLEREQQGEPRPNWLNFLFLSSNFVLICSSVFFILTIAGTDIPHVVPFVTYNVRQVYFSCLVNLFLVTVYQMEEILDAELHKVERSVSNGDLRELGRSLQLIDRIFRICELEMNVIFSVPLCLHFGYVVLQTASISYILALEFYDAFMVGLCAINIAPIVLYAALPTVRNHGPDQVVSIKGHIVTVECFKLIISL